MEAPASAEEASVVAAVVSVAVVSDMVAVLAEDMVAVATDRRRLRCGKRNSENCIR